MARKHGEKFCQSGNSKDDGQVQSGRAEMWGAHGKAKV